MNIDDLFERYADLQGTISRDDLADFILDLRDYGFYEEAEAYRQIFIRLDEVARPTTR